MNNYIVLLTQEGSGGNIRLDLYGETPAHALAQLDVEGRYHYELFIKQDGRLTLIESAEYVYRKETKDKPYEIKMRFRGSMNMIEVVDE